MNLSFEALRLRNKVLGTLAPTVAARGALELFLTPRRRGKAPDDGGVTRRTVSGLSVLHLAREQPSARVLGLHGWEGNATQLLPLGRVLWEAGAEVFLLDGPAHGQSPGTTAHPVAFAEALLEVGRALGPLDAALGHSMGGGALLLALREGLAVERAAVVAAPAHLETVLRRFAGAVGLPQRATAPFLREVERSVGRGMPEVSADLLAAHVKQAVLVVHDQNDREIPFSEGEALAKLLPRGTLHATVGLGHRRILRDAGVHQALRAALLGEAMAM